jgi:RNA polymerase sigma-70 factor (ECF subfamily)
MDYALLVLLERLSPDERAAYLLREIFEVDYALVASALGRSEAASRQLVHRARERLASGGARQQADPMQKAELLERFQRAVATSDASALVALLGPDATFTSDGGGKAFAAKTVVTGPARIARVVLGVASKQTRQPLHQLIWLGPEPAIASWRDGTLAALLFVDARSREVRALYKVMTPDKLRRAASLLGAV